MTRISKLAAATLFSGLTGFVLGTHAPQARLEATAVAAPAPAPAGAQASAAPPLMPPKGFPEKSTASPAQPPTSESFRSVARTVGPAVVVIRATQEAKPSRRAHGAMPGNPFFGGESEDLNPFFGLPPRGFGPPMPSEPKQGLGSGFIIDKRGYVVTNNHVVDGASKIEVVLSSGGDEDEETPVPATVVGRDPRTDLAVLKIKTASDLPTVQWGDSDHVEVGDWVVAIGSPFTLTHSVTAGIVSAKGRSSQGLMGSEYGYDLIQTDAAINPGNSGGPLCTLEGRVMGVNTAILSRDGGFMGIGFAIPSNLAKEVTDELIKSGQVTRGFLGVTIQKATKERLKEAGAAQGVVVHEVQANGPAATAGIRAGDLIIEAAGKPTKTPAALQRIVGATKPGGKIELKVQSYESHSIGTRSVKVGTLNADRIAKSDEVPEDGEGARWGLAVAPSPSGELRVDAVEPGSPAFLAGIRAGDVIVSVDHKRPKSADELRQLLKGKPHAGLLVKREGRTLFAGMTQRHDEDHG